MNVSIALTVLVGLTFLNCAIGRHTVPLDRRSLLTSEAHTGVARLLQSEPTASTTATAVKPTPRHAAPGVKAGNATASNTTGTAARTGLDKWETLADNPTLPPMPVVDTAGLGRKLLHPFDNLCTEADIARYHMGIHVPCMDTVSTGSSQPGFETNYDENREWGSRSWADRMAIGRGLRRNLGNFKHAMSADNNGLSRKLLEINGCTQAELQRASMGFDMECLQPYNDRWFNDRNWRRGFFVRPGRNFG